MKNISKGFTLLELLVVIGLIALLAAVVIAALGGSRNKGADGSIKANLRTIRSQAELFYVSNGDRYITSGSGQSLYTSYCNDPFWTSSFPRSIFNDPTIKNALTEALAKAGATTLNDSRCANSATAWAVSIRLKSSPTSPTSEIRSWCVDSTGQAKQVVGVTVPFSIDFSTMRCI